MDALTALVGGAIVGGADKYSQIQDEQRKYKIDEAKGEAEYNRQLNLARAKDQMGESGMMSAEGIPISKEQLARMTPEQRSALKNPMQQAAEMQKIKEAGQLSQFMNPNTRERLTNAQVEEFTKNGGKGLVSVGAQEYKDRVESEGRAAGRAEASAKRTFDYQIQRLGEVEKKRIATEARAADLATGKAEAAHLSRIQDTLLTSSVKAGQDYREKPDKYIDSETGKYFPVTAITQAGLVDNLEYVKKTMKPETYASLIGKNEELQQAEKTANIIGIIDRSGKVPSLQEALDEKVVKSELEYNNILDVMKVRKQVQPGPDSRTLLQKLGSMDMDTIPEGQVLRR